MKTTLKIIAVAAALLSANSAFAASTAACAGDGLAKDIASANFIVNPFNLKCSANVFLNYDATVGTPANTAVSVCAGSKKGNKRFGGSSDGGAVKDAGDLTGTITATSVAATASGCN